MKKIHIYLTAFALSLFFMACTGAAENKSSQKKSTTSTAPIKGQSTVQDELSAKNILQVALGSKDHSTLAAAVVAAGLEDVLVNAGPLTVFAPTNDAFAALPEGTVENLVKPENQKTLARIIKYHAAPGNYQGDLFKDGQRLFQASGHYVTVKKENGEVTVDGAKILGTVQASNGVVHVVDKVLLPPE